MSKVLDKSIKEIHDLLVNKKVTPRDLVEEVMTRIEERKELNAFITLNKTEALEYADKLSTEPVDKDNLLWGIPIAIKDNISTKDLRTTCASKMLDNYVPIYDATVIEKIKDIDVDTDSLLVTPVEHESELRDDNDTSSVEFNEIKKNIPVSTGNFVEVPVMVNE